MTSRVRQSLLDPGSIYKATSARLSDAKAQRRLAARAEEIGKRWSEIPATCRRAVLTALIERSDGGVDQIDIRFCPTQLSALLDVSGMPLQSVSDDDIEIRSVPVRVRRVVVGCRSW